MRKPTTRVPMTASAMTLADRGEPVFISSGAIKTIKVAQIVPPKAITEPLDKSIPPAMQLLDEARVLRIIP